MIVTIVFVIGDGAIDHTQSSDVFNIDTPSEVSMAQPPKPPTNIKAPNIVIETAEISVNNVMLE